MKEKKNMFIAQQDHSHNYWLPHLVMEIQSREFVSRNCKKKISMSLFKSGIVKNNARVGLEIFYGKFSTKIEFLWIIFHCKI